MLSGVNVDATLEIGRVSGVPVIASGGVASLTDIEALRHAARVGGAGVSPLLGAITGRAIYAGTLDFAAGQALFDAP